MCKFYFSFNLCIILAAKNNSIDIMWFVLLLRIDIFVIESSKLLLISSKNVVYGIESAETGWQYFLFYCIKFDALFIKF